MGKTLSEIIDQCKSGGVPDIDDALMAICVMDSLMVFDGLGLSRAASRELAGKTPVFTAEWQYAERFNRVKSAMLKPPIKWLGDTDNPDNPGVQKRRQRSNKIVQKIRRGLL